MWYYAGPSNYGECTHEPESAANLYFVNEESLKDFVEFQMSYISWKNTYKQIRDERKRQDEKWGVQSHHPFKWCTILGEEFGETCQAAFDADYHDSSKDMANYRKELIEVAAVAVAAIENFDRNEKAKAEAPKTTFKKPDPWMNIT